MMNKSRLYSILKRPIVTEKTSGLLQSGTYAFAVVTDANKQEIKAAVEEIFNVKVKSVNTLNYQGKVKRTGQRLGRRQDWKKAYITLVPGQTLEIGEGKAE
ncbi:MAG: 50S ribosomal protein L23 [Succinivibrionaceae bacterium]